MTTIALAALAAFPAGYLTGTWVTTWRIRRELSRRALITRHLQLTTRTGRTTP